eukprot:CAMPEP_0202871336 /NCGR_PEP_ID=MMETSP1391-20130828/18430_1 /ASSEMBLY_ACC=CAM_ASM_000867 /TAXON_ID=1034604 /ORGANISM="Chlamydomonas leiostraca, Strain SAG 11-49" /LENGTH=67 /DNA_ID=CAMNT_0049552103 /DNA_START=309 /DNA_END=512 /DNA_ORIENTATION=+
MNRVGHQYPQLPVVRVLQPGAHEHQRAHQQQAVPQQHVHHPGRRKERTQHALQGTCRLELAAAAAMW